VYVPAEENTLARGTHLELDGDTILLLKSHAHTPRRYLERERKHRMPLKWPFLLLLLL
jgi:hypothetical protein